jgi:hypothetical protein
VFGRSKDSTTAPAVEKGAGIEEDGTRPMGKGRPTPKRREAQRGRRRSMAPTSKKDAYRRMRDEQRAERQRTAHALRSGDEKSLPARDRGPVRRYVRDFVDARRSVAEFFLPIAVAILVLSIVPVNTLNLIASTLWMVVVVLIIVDSVVLVMQLKRGLRRTHPDESTKGVTAYALMRSMQIRRFRLPPPRIKPGRRR